MKQMYYIKQITGNSAKVQIETSAMLRKAEVGGDLNESNVSSSVVPFTVELSVPNMSGTKNVTDDVVYDGANFVLQLNNLRGNSRLKITATYGTNCKSVTIVDLVAPDNIYYFTYTDRDGVKRYCNLLRYADGDTSIHGYTYRCYRDVANNTKVYFGKVIDERQMLGQSLLGYPTTADGYFDFTSYATGRIEADCDVVTNSLVDGIKLVPTDSFDNGEGGEGGGMSQYILTMIGNTFYHNGEAVDFGTIKAAIEDTNKFVYLDFANALHLPCFIVDSEGNEALAFSSAFSVDGQPHIERVAINVNNVVKIDNYTLVSYTSSNGVMLGTGATASGNYAVAEGNGTTASGNYSHAEGVNTKATKAGSHAEGADTTASGNYSHAEGYKATASGTYSHAEGHNTTATAEDAHAEGHDTHATGTFAHAEGNGTIAGADTSHAEGYATSATANNAHAEGNNTLAQGVASHSEGIGSHAFGDYSHVQNQDCVARGRASSASGWRAIANTRSEVVIGEFNVQQAETPQERGEYMFVAGNGTAEQSHNAFAFGWDGSLNLFKSDGSAVKLTPELLESLLSLL